MSPADDSRPLVSRGGAKLAAALARFQVCVAGEICADFGSHVGGFVDCLLRGGAARVHSVDTSYGTLAFALRRDARVVVHERTNAMHFVAPELCGLVTIDVGWTPQHLILPAARRALRPGGHVITLVKPQYEAPPEARPGGVVPAGLLPALLTEVRRRIEQLGWAVRGELESPLRGHGGNVEYLFLLD